MILKGNQRAGAADLATHLLNEADNARVEVAEVTGTVAADLHGAFAEYEAVASGTQCREALYSLSINPSSPLSRDQYMAAIARIEHRLGLAGQPRAVIFHVKAGSGREHCHVVWSRIDSAKMRAVQLSHDRMKLRTLAGELAFEFGLELPPGLAQDRGNDRFFDPPAMRMAEKAQADATAIAPIERRAEVSAAWRSADGPAAFAQALEARGYFLAIGDRRAFVVVDRHGDVHSLARQIEGVKTKALNAFFGEYELPSLEQAKTHAAGWFQAQDDRQREKAASLRPAGAAILRRKQAARRLALLRRMRAQSGRHDEVAAALFAAQERERSNPAHRVFSAVLGLFARVPVLRSVLWHIRRRSFLTTAERHRLENEALERRHARERRDMGRLRRALRLVERRERQALTRSGLRAVRATDHKRDMLAVNAFDITAVPAERRGDERPLTPAASAPEAPAPTRSTFGGAADVAPEETPEADRDPLEPFIITAGSNLHHLLDVEPEPSEAGELALYEAQLDRLNYLRQWSLTLNFNRDACFDEMGWQHADPNFDPFAEDEDLRDPQDAAIERLLDLFDFGLTPCFNEAAGEAREILAGDDGLNEYDDPVLAELDRLHALWLYGLTPRFNASAGIERKRRSDDEEAPQPSAPRYRG